jgi:hypothetical protein
MLPDQPQEISEYETLVCELALNEDELARLDDLDSGTGAPPTRVVETKLLSGELSIVPAYQVAWYRAKKIRYREHLLAKLACFKRVKVDTYEFGIEAETKSAPTTKARRTNARRKGPSDGTNGKRKGAATQT